MRFPNHFLGRAPAQTSRRAIGGREESRALDHFQSKGWKLLDRNYRGARGEIDLIFREPGGAVVFMEVRYRASAAYGSAQATVNAAKQRRIVQTALHYIKRGGLQGSDFRFDVAALTPDSLEHIPNAFSSMSYTL